MSLTFLLMPLLIIIWPFSIIAAGALICERWCWCWCREWDGFHYSATLSIAEMLLTPPLPPLMMPPYASFATLWVRCRWCHYATLLMPRHVFYISPALWPYVILLITPWLRCRVWCRCRLRFAASRRRFRCWRCHASYFRCRYYAVIIWCDAFSSPVMMAATPRWLLRCWCYISIFTRHTLLIIPLRCWLFRAMLISLPLRWCFRYAAADIDADWWCRFLIFLRFSIFAFDISPLFTPITDYYADNIISLSSFSLFIDISSSFMSLMPIFYAWLLFFFRRLLMMRCRCCFFCFRLFLLFLLFFAAFWCWCFSLRYYFLHCFRQDAADDADAAFIIFHAFLISFAAAFDADYRFRQGWCFARFQPFLLPLFSAYAIIFLRWCHYCRRWCAIFDAFFFVISLLPSLSIFFVDADISFFALFAIFSFITFRHFQMPLRFHYLDALFTLPPYFLHLNIFLRLRHYATIYAWHYYYWDAFFAAELLLSFLFSHDAWHFRGAHADAYFRHFLLYFSLLTLLMIISLSLLLPFLTIISNSFWYFRFHYSLLFIFSCAADAGHPPPLLLIFSSPTFSFSFFAFAFFLRLPYWHSRLFSPMPHFRCLMFLPLTLMIARYMILSIFSLLSSITFSCHFAAPCWCYFFHFRWCCCW